MMRKDDPVSLDRTRFSRITVTSDEDDEVVIHAGARAESTLPATEDDDARCGEAIGGDMAGGDTSSDVPAAEEQTKRTVAADAPKEHDSSSDRPVRKTEFVGSDASSHKTTADDLELAPMSLMQKIIIILAGLAVVAIVVYIALMR